MADTEPRNLAEQTTIASGDWFVTQRGSTTIRKVDSDTVKSELEVGGTMELDITQMNDSGGDPVVKVVGDTTPVNEVTINSGDTGVAPKIEATGTDSNIELELSGNGTSSVKGKNVFGPLLTLTDATTIAWNAEDGMCAIVTLTDNRTLGNIANTQDGMVFNLFVVQDAGAAHTLAYASSYMHPNGTAPVVASGANDISLLSIIVKSSTEFAVASALDFS